tara:strand:+ start:1240 stop:1365 length:126 start_codon:yes stop_codon:yes gene_type:complete
VRKKLTGKVKECRMVILFLGPLEYLDGPRIIVDHNATLVTA